MFFKITCLDFNCFQCLLQSLNAVVLCFCWYVTGLSCSSCTCGCMQYIVHMCDCVYYVLFDVGSGEIAAAFGRVEE